ncbi:MAG TPA: DUF6263 family protein [Gemmataceae bacterium]|nr:DUF6263 family protein [Gemmataceae bacterium]
MPRFSLSRAVAGLLLVAFPTVLRAESVELRWRFTKGQVLKYLLKHREVRDARIGTLEPSTTTDTEYELEWTVQDVDDQGTATIEQKLTALRVSISGKDREFHYNSARANESTEAYQKKLIQLYDQLRFTTYRLKLKSDGTVAEVYGFDKLLDEIGSGLTGGGFNVLDFEGINVRDGSFGWFLQQALGTLPRGAIGQGAKWSQPVQAKLAGLGELTGRNDFTLGSVVTVGDRPCWEIAFKGAQSLEVDMKWIGNNLLRGTLKAGKLGGTIRFDAQAGKLAASQVEAEISGDLKLGAGDSNAVLKISFRHTVEMEAR